MSILSTDETEKHSFSRSLQTGLSEQIRVYNDHEIRSTQAEWKISLYKISRHPKLPPPGGWVLNKGLYGEAPPRGPTPYSFIYHFGREGTPFIYLLVKKGAPFRYLFLGSLVLIFM